MTRLLTPLADQPTSDLVHSLSYQTYPWPTTHLQGVCGHFSRGGLNCAECIDRELLRRKIDVAVSYPGNGVRTGLVFTRDAGGRVRREK